jgi:hypothetical protein
MASQGKPPSAEIGKLLDLLNAWDEDLQARHFGAGVGAQDVVDEAQGSVDQAHDIVDEAHDIVDEARDIVDEVPDIVDLEFGIEDDPVPAQASHDDISVTEQMQSARDQSLAKAVREPRQPAIEPAPAVETAENRFASHIFRGMWKIRSE